VRYSGASLGYQLASVLAGGLSPLIAVALLGRYGYVAVAVYMAIMALITVISVILASETFQQDILETQEGERQLATEGPGEPGTT
jgi:nitrate reductase NapE component